MNIFKIAVIPGDGIGKEVVKEGIKILNTIAEIDTSLKFEYEFFPWGCDYYKQYQKMMDENGIEILKNYDAIYLGAVGDPEVPDYISLWDLLLKIRKSFDQYINIRPIKLLKGADCPLKKIHRDELNMLFIRENSEGEYAGAGDWLFKNQENEVVLQNSVFSRKGTERVIRYAFEVAKQQGRSLTSISKANALNYSMVFWDQVFEEVSQEYPEVRTYSYLVDAAAMHMIADPKRFEVVVTSNLFGDILTDLGAALAGGIGLAAGANINPEGKFPSMFEPIHGSAPDIAGKGIANPLGAIWSVSQLIEHLGYKSHGSLILKAIEQLLIDKRTLTPDMGGSSTCEEVGDQVAEYLSLKMEGLKIR